MQMSKGAWTLALVLAGLAVHAGCGESESEQNRVASAVVGLQQDMRAGRVREVCAGLTETAQRQVGSVGHGRKPTTCVADLREFVVGTETGAAAADFEGLRTARRPEVVDVAISGDGGTAVVTLALGDDPFRLPLVKSAGRWKLDDFFGAAGPAPEELQ